MRALDHVQWPEDDAWLLSLPRQQTPSDPNVAELLRANREALALIPKPSPLRFSRAAEHRPSKPPAFMDGTKLLGHLVGMDATRRMARGDERGAFPRPRELPWRSSAASRRPARLSTTSSAAPTEHRAQVHHPSRRRLRGRDLDTIARQLEAFTWERDHMANALRREYIVMTELIDEQFEQEGGWKEVPFITNYLYQSNRTRKLYADTFSRAIESLDEDCSTAPPRVRQPSVPKWRYLAPNSMGRIFHHIGIPNLAGFSFSRCREQMSLGLTRLVLATRAYRADHGDSRRRSTPSSRATFPSSPETSTASPFRYSPARGVRLLGRRRPLRRWRRRAHVPSRLERSRPRREPQPLTLGDDGVHERPHAGDLDLDDVALFQEALRLAFEAHAPRRPGADDVARRSG